MFWGMKLNGPKSHVAFMSDEAIRISNLSLEVPEKEEPGIKSYVSFYIVNNKGEEFLVAQLRNPDRLNIAVDLDIDPEDDIMFRVKGEGTLHLAGYTLDEEDDFSDSESTKSCNQAANQLSGLRLASTTSGMPPPNFG